MEKLPTVCITGGSSGIGATYADRFAQRGHDLVLIAIDSEELATTAKELARRHSVAIDTITADLTNPADLKLVEARLRDDARIGILVNNAGAAQVGAFIDIPTEAVARLIALNTTSLARLASAIAPRLTQAGDGAIINISSIVALIPEFGMAVYGATKAFVLHLSQALSHELAPKGVHVQAVVPGGVNTQLWERAGVPASQLPPFMSAADLVDAALLGFDRRETVTIPPLQDEALWPALEAARLAMLGSIADALPAERYRTAG